MSDIWCNRHFIRQNYRKLLYRGKQLFRLVSRLLPCYKEASKKQDSSRWKTVHFHLGLLEDNFIKWWRKPTITVGNYHWYSLLKARRLLEHQPGYFLWTDQATTDTASILTSLRWNQWIRPSFKSIKIKEGKTVCYRQLIDHTAMKLFRSLYVHIYCLFRWPSMYPKGEEHILPFAWNELRSCLIPTNVKAATDTGA